ncbi:hypothetical protein [Mycobacterium sp. M26]|uniref:hypothetical protein n=1 Tax=Mycobacterium sp. M26 TaxID=1762962 RepID=UPI00073F6FD1|nr:hypothetical protein [Mycobacterium sp. M26]
MRVNRRVWWGTATVFLGLGAALLAGAGAASADSDGTGGSGRHADSSSSQPAASPSSNATSTATAGKRRAAPAAVVSGARVDATEAAVPTATTASAATSTGRSARAALLGAPARTTSTASPATAQTVDNSNRSLAAVTAPPATNGVTGVKVGHSTLSIPAGSTSYDAPADWYLPTQADGSVQANGVIWLQHGFLADKMFYSALATTLAQQTNSIVVAPTLPSFPSLRCPGCTLYGVPLQQGAASMFTGDRAALTISANAAGYNGALPEDFVLAGHSAGGGWSVSVGGYYIDSLQPNETNHLLGVVMYDGVNMNGTLPQAITSLDTRDIPVYQIAAPAQTWNAFGVTTDELVALRPDQFVGAVLVNGSHVDSMLGSNPLIDVSAQLVTQWSAPGNTQATYTLSTGWINDFYAGAGPDAPIYGLYGDAGQPIIMGDTAAVVLPTPIANSLGPLEQLMRAWTAVVLPLIFGGSVPTATPVASTDTVTALASTPLPNGVTGVKTGHSTLTIPVGTSSCTAPVDWYFPTSADGSINASGLIYFQHGGPLFGGLYSSLAMSLAQQTNSIVVVPTLVAFRLPFCTSCLFGDTPTQEGVAQLFLGDRAALNISANQAGYTGTLPEPFVLSGHSHGGEVAVLSAQDYEEHLAPGATDELLGVVMFDGVAPNPDGFRNALESLHGKPVYEISSPPSMWNNNNQAANELIADRPGEFVGFQIVNGVHFDSMVGSHPLYDALVQLVSGWSQPGNTAAVYTLANGWINDFYAGAGPSDPQYGYYGAAGQAVIFGQAAGIVLPTQPAYAAV